MEHDEDVGGIGPQEQRGPSRRTVIRGAAAGLAGAWAVPVITSFTSPAVAAGSVNNPNPECKGSSCGNFIPCSSGGDGTCVCTTTGAGNGFCVPGSTSCGPLATCGAGNTCPPGQVCLVDTCCSRPVCVPVELNKECPPNEDAGARTQSVPKSAGPGTIGG